MHVKRLTLSISESRKCPVRTRHGALPECLCGIAGMELWRVPRVLGLRPGVVSISSHHRFFQRVATMVESVLSGIISAVIVLAILWLLGM